MVEIRVMPRNHCSFVSRSSTSLLVKIRHRLLESKTFLTFNERGRAVPSFSVGLAPSPRRRPPVGASFSGATCLDQKHLISYLATATELTTGKRSQNRGCECLPHETGATAAAWIAAASLRNSAHARGCAGRPFSLRKMRPAATNPGSCD